MLTLYNSLSGKKETFVPLEPGKIRLYVCGITVYDDCHIGHARSLVSFDVIVRYLRYCKWDVTYVRNITDVDDKIIHRAKERNIPIEELTQHYIAEMHKVLATLYILPPDQEPRATESMPRIIELIQRLLDNGYAYVTTTGDVCFEVACFQEYGKLSNKIISDLLAGARVEITEEKRSPLDFVLWKKAKLGEPHWDSPWGPGRPGWHIECSAMSMQALGPHFDIHGGGIDLKFPHHENEIAQSEAASSETFANYWMHIGMLLVNNEKMSKSTGNFFTIQDVLQKWHPEVIRYFLLSNHYRSPLHFSSTNIENAAKALTRLYQALQSVVLQAEAGVDLFFVEQFEAAMNDDFNTPVALSVLFQLSHELYKNPQAILGNTLKTLAQILGLLQHAPQDFLQRNTQEKESIEEWIELRRQAKIAKDWQRADQIRNLLKEKGVELADGPEGTTWRSVE